MVFDIILVFIKINILYKGDVVAVSNGERIFVSIMMLIGTGVKIIIYLN